MVLPEQYAWYDWPQEAKVTSELELVEFSATDRCDRCGAKAHHLARKPGFSDLLFCGHHIRRLTESLLDKNWNIISDSVGVAAVSPAIVPVKN